jgi:hypothetical protein
MPSISLHVFLFEHHLGVNILRLCPYLLLGSISKIAFKTDSSSSRNKTQLSLMV